MAKRCSSLSTFQVPLIFLPITTFSFRRLNWITATTSSGYHRPGRLLLPEHHSLRIFRPGREMQNLDPDWLRIGTDIVGGNPAPTFNMAFSLEGVNAVPEPATWAMMTPRLRWRWVHGLSPEVKARIDGRLIHDHQV